MFKQEKQKAIITKYDQNGTLQEEESKIKADQKSDKTHKKVAKKKKKR